MHAHAQEPAVADAARPDSPIDMHRDDASSGAQPSGAVDPQSPSGGPDTSMTRPAPVQQAAQLLGHRLKIGVKDGRVLEGDFHCLDKLGNIILNNTNQLEHRDGSSKQHHMGLVLVPDGQRLSCEMLVMPGERERVLAILEGDT